MSKIKTRKQAQHVLEHANQVAQEIERTLNERDNDAEEIETLCLSAARCAIIKAAITSMEVMK